MQPESGAAANCSNCGTPRTRTECPRCRYVEPEDRDPRYDDMDAPVVATTERSA